MALGTCPRVRRTAGAWRAPRCAQLCEHGGPHIDPMRGGSTNRLCTYEDPETDCTPTNVYDAQDRLRSFGSISYNYTDRGSLYQKLDGSDLTTYVYDALGNLTHVMEDGGQVIHYVIDAQGHRVGKQINGVLQKQYVWGDSLRISAELDGNGNVKQRFIYGMNANVPDLVVKLDPVNGDRLYRVITDQLGSPIYVVNIANPADVLLDATYDEWGNVTAYTSSTGSWPIPFGFAGGLYDEDTNLVRFGERDYDPEVGRWTAKDPILFAGGQGNLYVYVGNDPLNWTDVTGLIAGVPDWLEDFDNSGGLQAIGDFFAGSASAVTFGLSDKIIGASGLGAYGSTCSAAYTGGEIAATILVASGPTGPLFGRQALRGKELGAGLFNRGKNLRVGWSWKAAKGRNYFSIHGGTPRAPGHWHVDLIPGPKNPIGW